VLLAIVPAILLIGWARRRQYHRVLGAEPSRARAATAFAMFRCCILPAAPSSWALAQRANSCSATGLGRRDPDNRDGLYTGLPAALDDAWRAHRRRLNYRFGIGRAGRAWPSPYFYVTGHAAVAGQEADRPSARGRKPGS